MISVPLILLGHWRGNGLAILCDPGIPMAPEALGVEAYMAHVGLQF